MLLLSEVLLDRNATLMAVKKQRLMLMGRKKKHCQHLKQIFGNLSFPDVNGEGEEATCKNSFQYIIINYSYNYHERVGKRSLLSHNTGFAEFFVSYLRSNTIATYVCLMHI